MKRLAFLAPSLFVFAMLCFQSVSLQAQIPFSGTIPSPVTNPAVSQPQQSGSIPVFPNGGGAAPPPPMSEPLPDALLQRGQAELKKPGASDGWTRPTAFGQNCAVYFVLQGGAETDMLKSVSTAWADKVDIHQTTIDEQGVARMAVLPELDVAAESRIEFSPRGLHLMVTGLKRELRAGQFFPVLLNFEHAGQVRLMVSVRKSEAAVSPTLSQPEPMPDHMPDHMDVNHAPH